MSSEFTFKFPIPSQESLPPPNWGQPVSGADTSPLRFAVVGALQHAAGPDPPSVSLQPAINPALLPAAAVPKKSRKKQLKREEDRTAIPEVTAKRGRPHGAGNYSDSDIKILLKFVQAELPLGPRGWCSIHTKFNKWAREHQRPEREVKSLETKFKQLVKVSKPTGSGTCPPNVEKAHRIELLINEHAGTHDLQDSDFDDNGEEREEVEEVRGSSADKSDDEGDAIVNPPARKVTARISRVDAKASHPTHGSRGPIEVIERLTHALNPVAQQSCDEQRNSSALQTTQFLLLSQQLHDSQLQATNEALRVQIIDLTTKALTSQLKLELAQKVKTPPQFKYHAPRRLS